MLQRIRDSIQGWMAYLVVAILVVPFAFWGIGDYLGIFGEDYAAKVNDEEIPLVEYRNNYTQRYAQLRDLYGAAFRAEMIDEARLRQEVLEQMVDEELLYQHAIERGFRVPDSRIIEDIHGRAEFQEDGAFSPERYRYMLQLNGQSPTGFERRLRRGLTIQQLQRAYGESSFIPTTTLHALLRIADQRREVAWIDLRADSFIGRVEITDAQVAEHYEANRARFMTAEAVDIAWVELTIDSLVQGIEVDESDLQRFYEERRRELTAGERRLSRHILVTFDGRSVEEAEAIARSAHARIEAGEAFEDVARELSEDPDTAEEGGALGWVERGIFGPDLEEALFALEAGQLSAPVRSSFGWHVLRADEVESVPVPTFDEMRGELVVDFAQSEAEKQFYDMVERLADLAYENPDSLEPAAEALGLEIRVQRGATRDSDNGLMANPAVKQAVFSPQVLEEGFNSQVLELDSNHAAVVRVDQRRPPVQLPLEVVRDRIYDGLRLLEARRVAAETGELIIEHAREGAGLETLAREHGGDWHAPRLVGRSDAEVPPSLLAALYRTPRPADGPVTRGLRIGANDYAVYQLLSVVPGAPEGLEEADIEGLRDALSTRTGSSEYSALLADLRNRASIAYGRNLFDES